MNTWSFRSRTAWIMPLVLLLVALLEELATYKIRRRVDNIYLRVAIIVALKAFAFTTAAAWIAPHLRDLLAAARRRSARRVGGFGLWFFYALAYGALFLAYLTLERRGIGGLLPAALR
jgi:hypothetical protein